MKKLKKIIPDEQYLIKIAQLYCTCFNAPEKAENWTMQSALEYFRDRVNEASIFAVLEEADGSLSGVCCGGPFGRSFIAQELEFDLPRTFYISLVAVEEKFRGRGVGRGMIHGFCALAEAEGYKGFMVRCRAENEPMLRALAHEGFSELGRYEAELGGVTCERVVLRKGLSF